MEDANRTNTIPDYHGFVIKKRRDERRIRKDAKKKKEQEHIHCSSRIKPVKMVKQEPVAANIMASSVAATGIAPVVRGEITRTPEQKQQQEEAARKHEAKRKRRENEEREAKWLAKARPAHTNRGRKKLTRKL